MKLINQGLINGTQHSNDNQLEANVIAILLFLLITIIANCAVSFQLNFQ